MTTLIIVLIIILVIIYLYQNYFSTSSEKFTDSTNSTNSEPLKLYIFVSGHCHHCITYLQKHHDKVVKLCELKGIELNKIESDGTAESSDLFSQYDVKYVPTAILVKGDKIHKKLGSVLTPEAISKELQ